jgi:hypothetical protein
MSNVVPSSFQAASQELIAKLIKAGYLRPALRNDADAVTTAIARLKQDLRGGGGSDATQNRYKMTGRPGICSTRPL